MTTTEAFEALGLPSSATEQEIEAKFRALAHECHPDQGGTKEAMQQLNQAREVALEAAALARSMVPTHIVRDLVVATTTALSERSEAINELQTVSTRIKQTLTNRLRSFRQISTWVVGIAAGAFFLRKELELPMKILFPVKSGYSERTGALMAFTVLTVGAYCAVLHWLLTRRIERAVNLTEQLTAHLSVRPYYVSFLESITHGTDNWTFKDLESYVTEWANSPNAMRSRWSALARDAGSEDFARLVVAKGQELGILTRTEHINGRSLIETFSLSFGGAMP